MADFWNALLAFIKGLFDFLDWYIEDTPLFEDTLDALYAVSIQAYNELAPVVAEHIRLISEYFHGAGGAI